MKNTTANSWLVEAFVEPAADADAGTHPNGLIASGSMAFNTDGTLDLTGTTAGLLNLNITWAATEGVNNSALAVDFGTDGATDGMTQFDSNSQLVKTETDGAVFGSLTGIGVGEDGVVTALFENGSRRDLYKLQRAWDTLEVGGVVIGEVPSWRVDHMPYGGVKDSGLGREGIRFAMEDMTEIRLLVIRTP